MARKKSKVTRKERIELLTFKFCMLSGLLAIKKGPRSSGESGSREERVGQKKLRKKLHLATGKVTAATWARIMLYPCSNLVGTGIFGETVSRWCTRGSENVY